MKPKLLLHLFHGRHRPDQQLDDWGEDGPWLEIEWLHATYMTTFSFGVPDELDVFYCNQWQHREQSGTFVEELFYYNGMFYGDWEIMVSGTAWSGDKPTEAFKPELAVFPKEKHWQDLPMKEGWEYNE